MIGYMNFQVKLNLIDKMEYSPKTTDFEEMIKYNNLSREINILYYYIVYCGYYGSIYKVGIKIHIQIRENNNIVDSV